MVDIEKRGSLFLSVFLICFASLLAEILLTRIFSVTIWYHFAFFVISLVMFGLSFGGTVLFIFKRHLIKLDREQVIFGSILFTAASFLPILFIVPKTNFALNFYQAFYSFNSSIYFEIFKLFILCQLPFFFIGFLMSYLFLVFHKESGRIYFFDLLGASCGALFSILFINFFGPIPSLILLGVISSLALISVSDRRKIGLAFLVLLVFISLLAMHSSFDITMAKGKTMDGLFTKWNSLSVVRVGGNENSTMPNNFGWGISRSYNGSYPPQLWMDIDAEAATAIIRFDGDLKKVVFLRYDITSFAYYLSNNSTAFIIGPGGGIDVLTALLFGVKNVTAVDVNPIIVNDVMKGRFKYYSGNLYFRKDVRVFVDDARSYIRNSLNKYDIIQASLVDTWAASSAGAYSLSENNIYTVEAVSEYISHLSDNGYLTISRWQGPESLKLTILYLKAAEKLGIKNPERHIVVLNSSNVVNVIFKKSEITDDDKRRIDYLANSLGFGTLYSPNSTIQDEIYSSLINSKNIDEFIATQSYNLKPSTDDSPFFFNNKRFTSVPNVLLGLDKDVGFFLLYALFLVALILTAFLIMLPLLLSKQTTFKTGIKCKLPQLIYFSILGLSFMIVEVSLLQKFILFLGHPVYAITAILFSILLFAGIGSFLTDRIVQDKLRKSLKIILAIVVGILVAYNLFLYPIFNMLIGSDIIIRLLISVLLLSVLGVFAGMPFPIGIKVIGLKDEELIPLCWSINGAFSVLGSIIAVILSMNIGFTKTLFIAAGLYAVAYFISSKSL